MKITGVFTLILALFMTLSVFSFSAFAEENNDPTKESETTTTTQPTEPPVDYKVSGDWRYKDITEKTVKLVGYTGSDSKCVIPGSLENKTVVSVAEGIVKNNSTIIEVVIDGKISEVNSPYPIPEKFRAFGWNVIEIDAHSFDEIDAAFNAAAEFKGKPSVIIANSVKGKGVSFMEDQVSWHGTAPNAEQYEQAMSELKQTLADLEA